MSQIMANDLTYEITSRHIKEFDEYGRHVHADAFPTEGLNYELDLGSLLTFNITADDAPVMVRAREVLERIAAIAQHDWCWACRDVTVYDEVNLSQIRSGIAPEKDHKISAPVDHRKVIAFNFASRDDAMLVRMTIADLRSAKYDDGGGLSSKA